MVNIVILLFTIFMFTILIMITIWGAIRIAGPGGIWGRPIGILSHTSFHAIIIIVVDTIVVVIIIGINIIVVLLLAMSSLLWSD